MTNRTVLDVIADVFGEPLGPEVIMAAGRMSRKEGNRLHDAAQRWAVTFELPEKSPSELRPFIPNNWGSRIGLGISDPFQVADLVKQHLLYCHSVALESPLISIGWNVKTFDNQLSGVIEYHFTTLLQLAPLIEAGIVIYVPEGISGQKVPEWQALSSKFRIQLNRSLGSKLRGGPLDLMLAEVARSLDTSDLTPSAYAGELPEGIPTYTDPSDFSLAGFGYNYVTQCVGAVIGTGGSVDLLMHYRYQEQVLRRLVQLSPATLMGPPGPVFCQGHGTTVLPVMGPPGVS